MDKSFCTKIFIEERGHGDETQTVEASFELVVNICSMCRLMITLLCMSMRMCVHTHPVLLKR